MKNIVEKLFENTGKYPDKVAIAHKSEKITYSELMSELNLYAGYFTEKGIKKGDKVLVFVPMGIELYKILCALFYIGATAVFLDAWSTKNRLEQALQIVQCKAFIGIPKAHLLQLTSKKIRQIPIKLVSAKNRFRCKTGIQNNFGAASPDDIALITFTTGSTGLPKAAKRTHDFLLQQHYTLREHMKPDVNDIDLTTLPIFVLNNLAVGSTSVIPNFEPGKPERINPAKILRDINNYQVNTTTGSPVFYDKLAEFCIEKNIYPASLNKVFLGGAPVFPKLAGKLQKAFKNTYIEIVYGSTEAEPISSITVYDLLNKSLSLLDKGLPVGTPIDSIDIKILESSEICVSGNHVLKEYYNCSEAQKLNKVTMDGKIWHRTGDGGYIDNDGHLYLLGRVKNKFTFDNKEYYVFPIENALLEIEEINLGTVLEINDNIYLIIEPIINSNKYQELIKLKLKPLKIPHNKIIFINKISRDPRHNSKIDYDKLKNKIL